MKRIVLMALLLIPFAYSSIGIYAKEFSIDCYIYRSSVAELVPESPFVLSAFLRDMGFDVQVFEDTRELSKFDGVVVLSCTTMSPEDIEKFVEFYRKGGGLLIDLRSYNPLAEKFGVVKKTYELEGIERSGLTTTYVTITNGVLVKGAIVSASGPIRFGYERMYYVGEPIYLPSSFNSGFATESGENVLGWMEEGRKRVAVTGCLYCSDPLLLANLVDWIEDGTIDFPSFSVVRKVMPDAPSEGDLLVDEIRVLTDEGVRVRGEYVYGLSGPFCDFGEPKTEFKGPEKIGDKYQVEALFSYRARGSGSCLLPPVLVTLEYGEKRREVLVEPVEVVVSKKAFVAYREEVPLALGAIVFVALVSLAVLRPYLRRRYLMREREKLRKLIKLTMKRRMQGELTEEAYKELISEYQKKLQEIELELSLSDGEGRGPSKPRPRWLPRSKRGEFQTPKDRA